VLPEGMVSMILDWGRLLIFYGGILCAGLLLYFLYRNHKKNSGKSLNINCDNDVRDELVILNVENKVKREIIAKLLFAIGVLPLLIYFPLILGAVGMGLAAMYDSGDALGFMKIPAILWMFFILAYPLTYIICWFYYFKKGKRKIVLPFLPLIHIFIVLIPFIFFK
jgi:hypothetical protein